VCSFFFRRTHELVSISMKGGGFFTREKFNHFSPTVTKLPGVPRGIQGRAKYEQCLAVTHEVSSGCVAGCSCIGICIAHSTVELG
jgi:hypothetical protein